MSIWTTFRIVPPIALEAVAWAALSLATYLAAVAFHPQFSGKALDPLALALAVQLALILTRNAISVRAANAFRNAPVAFILIVAHAYIAIALLGLFASAAVAAKFFIAYLLCYSATLVFMACKMPDELPYVQGVWTSIEVHRPGAVKLEAVGLLVCAATLLGVWMFGPPLAFVLMMSCGVLAIRWFTNWIVVLYLLDAENRTAGTGADE